MTTNVDLIEEARFYESPGHVAAYAEGTLELLRKLADALETQLAATRVPVQGERTVNANCMTDADGCEAGTEEPNDDREAILRKALEHVREVGESGLAGPYVHDLPKDVDPNWGWTQTMWPVVVAVDIALASRATVPDAATEELRPSEMTAEETIKLVLKRPGMYGLVPDTEHRSMKAERDAALAALERIRVAVSGHPECDRYEEDDVISCGWKSAYASVLAALDEAPEPEWEYSVGFNDPECGWINDHADIHDCYEDARSDYSEPNWLVEDRVVRRRKAGPWLPVEGEKP